MPKRPMTMQQAREKVWKEIKKAGLKVSTFNAKEITKAARAILADEKAKGK